jgi:hypothetical protein
MGKGAGLEARNMVIWFFGVGLFLTVAIGFWMAPIIRKAMKD